MVTLAILAKQKALSVPALRKEMPAQIWIRPDPRTYEKNFRASELKDSVSIYDLMENGWQDDEGEDVGLFMKPCEVSRRSVPYVEGGPAPADDYNDIWDVVIPGGVDDTVRVSQAAILLQRSEPEYPSTPPGPPNFVYTITAIGQDRLKYIARITMVAYGLRN